MIMTLNILKMSSCTKSSLSDEKCPLVSWIVLCTSSITFLESFDIYMIALFGLKLYLRMVARFRPYSSIMMLLSEICSFKHLNITAESKSSFPV
jgi:hypothetical protein